MAKVDITFVKDEQDPGPYRYFKRIYVLATLKRWIVRRKQMVHGQSGCRWFLWCFRFSNLQDLWCVGLPATAVHQIAGMTAVSGKIEDLSSVLHRRQVLSAVCTRCMKNITRIFVLLHLCVHSAFDYGFYILFKNLFDCFRRFPKADYARKPDVHQGR